MSDQKSVKSAFTVHDELKPDTGEHIRSIVSDSIAVKRRFFDAHAPDVTRAAEIIGAAFRDGHKLLVCGNGGSAADAQHIAGGFVNQFLLMRKAVSC